VSNTITSRNLPLLASRILPSHGATNDARWGCQILVNLKWSFLSIFRVCTVCELVKGERYSTPASTFVTNNDIKSRECNFPESLSVVFLHRWLQGISGVWEHSKSGRINYICKWEMFDDWIFFLLHVVSWYFLKFQISNNVK